MGDKRKKKFIYNDMDERYKRMNKIYVMCISYIWVLLVAYLLLRLRSESILPAIVYANLVLIVVRSAKGVVELNLESVCGYICIYQLLFIVSMVGSVAREYSEHALGSVEEQSGMQKKMVDGIIDVSKTVQGEAVKSSDMVDNLLQATESVVTSMERIVAATNTTALSIEEQNSMTQTIQRAIGETSERSKKMVSIAVTSNESIQENIKVMNELKEQSKLIATTNQEVTAAMDRLQDKTKEVEEIAGMILPKGLGRFPRLFCYSVKNLSAAFGSRGDFGKESQV